MLPCILALLMFIDGSNTSPVADPDVLEGSPSAELPLQPKAGAGCADLLYKTEPHWQAGSAQHLEPSSWRAGLRSTACLNCDNSCLTVPWLLWWPLVHWDVPSWEVQVWGSGGIPAALCGYKEASGDLELSFLLRVVSEREQEVLKHKLSP
ncbi:hypothetical protein Nmel_011105 [Mimus melanotis]